MLTLLEWEQTQSSKNCVFIKAHEHTTLLLFSKNTLQVQFCNWKKAKGGFPGYLILASIMCLEIRESHLTFSSCRSSVSFLAWLDSTSWKNSFFIFLPLPWVMLLPSAQSKSHTHGWICPRLYRGKFKSCSTHSGDTELWSMNIQIISILMLGRKDSGHFESNAFGHFEL